MSQSKQFQSIFQCLPFMVLLTTVFSCGGKKEIDTSLTTINLVEAYAAAAPINISDFASDIEYIQLETSEETLYSRLSLNGVLGDSIILVKSYDRISLFNRANGKYIKDVGHKGDDPEGFSNAMGTLGVNARNSTVYARGKRFDLYEYSLKNGRLVNTLPGPNIEGLENSLSSNSMDVSLITAYGILGDSLLVGYFMNNKGDEPIKLVVYNPFGEVIKLHPNNQSFVRLTNIFRIESPDFRNYKNQLFFKETHNDTVFNVTADTLKPAFFYQLGEFSPPYEKQETIIREKRNELMFVLRTLQSPSFIFFSVRFKEKQAYRYYNRKTQKTLISDPSNSDRNAGFTNDIDDFVPFYPTSINDDGEMMGLVTAEEIYEWFQNNPDKIASLPKNLQALQNIDPEDNPIVMITKLK